MISYASQAVQTRHAWVGICVIVYIQTILHEDRCSPFWSPYLFFFGKYQHRKKMLLQRKTTPFHISRRNANFTKIPMLRIVVWRVLRVCSNYSLCCGGSTLCIKLDLYQRDQLNVEALVYLSMWFKVCTCPKLIEWQIRFFSPSNLIVKGGLSLSDEALKFDRFSWFWQKHQHLLEIWCLTTIACKQKRCASIGQCGQEILWTSL